jgi:glucose/arabinose dehydrogenase
VNAIKILTAILVFYAAASFAQPRVELIADHLNHPWAVAFLPNDTALITERPGRLLQLDLATGRRMVINGTPEVDARGQGGLLDIELHPDFTNNRWVYFTWAGACERGNATHIGRGRLVGQTLHDFETLLVATPCVTSTKHFGSRLVFDADGFLYATIGERGERERAQDLNDHNGSVLRLNDDGSIPATNPFVGGDNAKPAIYSFGHRNPQGAAIHPHTGELWIHEHGPRGGDEINQLVAGGNFGWPDTTYGREYWGPEIGPDTLPETLQPLYQWTPSIAPSGMAFYQAPNDRDHPWQSDLFIGALAKVHLAKLALSGDTITSEAQLLSERSRRIRAIEQGSDGRMYVLTDHADGELLAISPQN